MLSRLLAIVLLSCAAGASADATNGAQKTVRDLNKIYCKRETQTGSLVSASKVCHTEAEWQLLREQNRERVREMQSVAASTRSGG